VKLVSLVFKIGGLERKSSEKDREGSENQEKYRRGPDSDKGKGLDVQREKASTKENNKGNNHNPQ